MITKKNFKQVLESLEFNEDKTDYYIHRKSGLAVDFAQEKLIYPEEQGFIVNERQTCNFAAPENFVVFECVHRLLEKGYPPQKIELEKRWTLGHSQKSGRADISVFLDDDKTQLFMIVECKTAGAEYNKALKILKEDGGQLFSYWQQDRSTQCLSLYASDFSDGEVSYKN
ncbi:type I restriction enzyme HsdR N-terminal domain-containing protein, partial [Streptococcus oralis]|uniref:type I restriction enzyme HsdR N-terminal domain-containing protein n=1 Tax=Streptococcus oralis TaxID=1303 RepID=UPI000AC9FF16